MVWETMRKRCELIIQNCVELGHDELRARHVEIDTHTCIRSCTHIVLVSSIGRFCSIASDVFIGQEKYTHFSDWMSSHFSQYTKLPLTYAALTDIEHDVLLTPSSRDSPPKSFATDIPRHHRAAHGERMVGKGYC